MVFDWGGAEGGSAAVAGLRRYRHDYEGELFFGGAGGTVGNCGRGNGFRGAAVRRTLAVARAVQERAGVATLQGSGQEAMRQQIASTAKIWPSFPTTA